jgi:hypothetical protein
MTERSLQVTYRKGRTFAAYLHLSHQTGEKSARASASPDGLLVVDYDASGRALGIEITAPQAVTLERLNQLLTSSVKCRWRSETTSRFEQHNRTIVSGQHHVSRFHLSAFCDPAASGTTDPWLWIGSIANGSTKRRSPKNVGTVSGLFSGPGGLADPAASLEKFLANEVEGPAAKSLRYLLKDSSITALPPEVMRYLAWAASRSLPMQRIEAKWAERFHSKRNAPVAEPPPPAIANCMDRERWIRLIHPVLGEHREAQSDSADELMDDGWIPDMTEQSNFLEGAHIQAHYFQVRWFPRLRWFTLRPPGEQYFIIGDRPVGWGIPGCLEAPPNCLRDESAFLVAPLARDLVLVGRNDPTPWQVTPGQVNAMLAAWAHDWIAGPTEAAVVEALHGRRAFLSGSATH